MGLLISNMYMFNGRSNPPKSVGRYTQMVWAETYTIGCGEAFYRSSNAEGVTVNKAFFVCNYGPAGNIANSPVYSIGVGGSACPPSTYNKDSLCAKNGIDVD
ncbi:hypothetical protein GHT06_015097 [Daphnia sinensis]|uniref:SCP domain-containing protein n=1 Tax=Daphnia sinensis TaxID=1820382 RepID=A0AAD5PVU0_9CRUS|nr:hypothetical protein GHT06_015097 [Daphnia sinensis]